MEISEVCTFLSYITGMEWEERKGKREPIVDSLFFIQEFITKFLEHPNYTALCMTNPHLPDYEKLLINRGDLELWIRRNRLKKDVSSVLHRVLIYFIGLSHYFKEHLLGVESVKKVQSKFMLVSPEVYRIPIEVHPKIREPLRKLINGTVVLIPDLQGLGDNPVEWMKVRELDSSSISPYLSYLPCVSIRGTPALVLKTYPSLIFCNHYPPGYVEPHNLIDFFFYFSSEQWAKFTVDLLNGVLGAVRKGGGTL